MATTGDITSLVFKRAAEFKTGGISLDAQALKTLLALDGRAPLGEVAQKLEFDMATIGAAMKSLAAHGLIVRVDHTQKKVSRTFMPLLQTELLKATGPIAEALLDDILEDMRLAPDRIPAAEAPELVNALSREIPDEQRRLAFIRTMLSALQA